MSAEQNKKVDLRWREELGVRKMRLVPVNGAHLRELMGWFPDPRSCAVWAGHEFRYPFTETTFREDIRPELPSYALIGGDGELLGFGQFYLREKRCHLARLVISPNHRGRGFGTFMIRALCERGCRKLRVRHCSLFVLADNARAVALYSRLGFAPTKYPRELPEGCIYMVGPLHKISNRSLRGR